MLSFLFLSFDSERVFTAPYFLSVLPSHPYNGEKIFLKNLKKKIYSFLAFFSFLVF